ncbi:MAG: DUF4115 domain-containing protein [Candidatus Moranbacteria bacterium]|nr:DUF4115 domain-containing protein [Candidatus Moranbacteria bacterium]
MARRDFTRKKIDSLTLGERMKKIRSERRLSLSEISKNTKIQAKYLEYLENGQYEKLPADVYVKGFLKSYAAYTGVSEKALIKLYEREEGIQKNIKKTDGKKEYIGPIKISGLVITPRILVISFVILVILVGIFYLYKEVDTFIATPRLVVVQPADGEIIEGDTVNVKGIAEKDAEVFINDQPVLVSENGEFNEHIGLQEGINTITVKAVNKFRKESIRTVSVKANYAGPAEGNSATGGENKSQTEKKLEVEITVQPNSTWLSVEADGSVVFSGTLLPQAVQKFSANEKISITSGKGNNTYLKINGKDIGVLSNDPGIVRDVIFDANTKY